MIVTPLQALSSIPVLILHIILTSSLNSWLIGILDTSIFQLHSFRFIDWKPLCLNIIISEELCEINWFFITYIDTFSLPTIKGKPDLHLQQTECSTPMMEMTACVDISHCNLNNNLLFLRPRFSECHIGNKKICKPSSRYRKPDKCNTKTRRTD